ncbi:MAG: hypothetical protein IPI67_03015 [Myxococcales bacterium]|nr:hypothetical protein [Myxococcales bacterium]
MISRLHRSTAVLGLAALAVSAVLSAPRASAQEPASCLNPDPSKWPAASRPYFMLVVDTSGSMIGCTNPSTSTYQFPSSCPSTAPKNSCNMEPTRINDAKCALRNTVQAFSGEVNFGLATFPVRMAGCGNGACVDTCTAANGSCTLTAGVGTSGEYYSGNGCTVSGFPNASGGTSCGNLPSCPGTGPAAPNFAKGTWRNGGNLVVDMLQDPTWGPNPPPTNVPELLKWFDGNCNESKELFAIGGTPIAGSLRTTAEYMRAGWNLGWTNANYCQNPTFTSSTPVTTSDRACRNLNVILVTDGDEGCDTDADGVAAAQDLFQNGVTLGTQNWKVKTHVIGFAGASQAKVDAIAAAGGTVAALSANSEVQLSQALAKIISSGIKPEVCNNTDDNCNGCTDEGYNHYCNQRTDCCTLARATCLSQYTASITPANPQGDLTKLPCVNQAQSSQPPTWLCYNPTEQCNGADDNCNAQIDEGVLRCGNPLHCPTPEICNNDDDNCDGVIDNASGSGVPYSACPNNCQPSAEICDGCDNDCDGVADDGVAAIPCGFSPPGNCAGTQSCLSTGQAVPVGGCVAAGVPKGFGSCNNTPQTEICDGLDNNCNGTVDEGISPVACTIPGKPGLVYNDTFPQSQCVKGLLPCNGTCTGFIGPTAEVCDGIDNDCNGSVDDAIPGLGQPCGIQGGICTKGATACVGGALVCQGGNPPQPEKCNGVDDDCDGSVDDAPLSDQPTTPGCWNLPATGCNPVCSHANAQWCPPPGGTCSGKGTLSDPCQAGSLVCNGTQGWKCQGGKTPSGEVCDGVDNDCNGSTDDNLTGVGQDCGLTTPPCAPGKTACVNGAIECQGGVKPTAEVCNGKDDNCNGIVDDGLGLGGPCSPTYDTNLYPGDRTKGVCTPGVSACDSGGTGKTICQGGVGPSPEICDGIDNDCDGKVDEPGPAPDGIDGTTNPSDPNQKIGDACGTDQGECKKGQLICDSGKFVCANAVGPQPEQCDCQDNDCDGKIDNTNGAGNDAGGLPICSPGKTCVEVTAGVCQCAVPCKGEICPGGATCENVTKSGTTETGPFCVNDPCGDCKAKTVKNPTTGEVVCGPKATTAGGLPECVCKGDLGCQSPCFGVQCPSGQACAPSGPAVGSCQPDNNCNFFGCKTGEACSNGNCVDDPCDPNTCAADEVCKPNESFTEPRCVKSCAAVTCQAGELCVEGTCTPTGCGVDCPTGQVCAGDGDAGFACAPNKCSSDAGLACSNGAYCDPATGSCGNDPCTAVKCPAGQSCELGECQKEPEPDGGGTGGTSGTGGASGAAGKDGGGGAGGTSGAAGSAGSSAPKGVWGLATGGGGCACTSAGERGRATPFALALFALGALTFTTRRRRLGRAAGLSEVSSRAGESEKKGDWS